MKGAICATKGGICSSGMNMPDTNAPNTIKGENAYSASAFVMLMGAFVSGMFIPLDQLPPFVAQIAPFTPLYGAVQAIYAVAGTVTMPTAAWLNIAGWAVVTAGIAWWGASHDTDR